MSTNFLWICEKKKYLHGSAAMLCSIKFWDAPKRCKCLSSIWFNYKETETRVWHNRIGPENLPVRYGFSEVGFGIFFFLEKLNIPIRYKIKSENLKNNFLIKKYYVAFRGPIESYLKKFGLVRFFNFVSVLYNLKIKRINIKTEPNGKSQIGFLKVAAYIF